MSVAEHVIDVGLVTHENMCMTFVRTIFCLVSLAVSVVLAAPLAIIIGLVMALFYEIYYAYILARRNQNDAALVFAQHSLTNATEQAQSTVQLMMSAGFEFYLDNDFLLSLAGVPSATRTLLVAFARFQEENTHSPKGPNVYDGENDITTCSTIDTKAIIAKRARLGQFKRAEIDFDQLINVNVFIPFGSQTSYTLSVLTEYAVQSVKIKPSTLQDLKQELSKRTSAARKKAVKAVKAVKAGPGRPGRPAGPGQPAASVGTSTSMASIGAIATMKAAVLRQVPQDQQQQWLNMIDEYKPTVEQLIAALKAAF